ncbi:hypothetical protein B0H17DRAFT_1130156 [Mycena rosella]|uniref:Uncharacterized protein n=1 Tax=Mycena rosella TaxID=1033263 RepID=A0AAD7DR95_MYCRO|nr:hypothetical protein B0H17DRAFT_1130156 [Mycena rosella]
MVLGSGKPQHHASFHQSAAGVRLGHRCFSRGLTQDDIGRNGDSEAFYTVDVPGAVPQGDKSRKCTGIGPGGLTEPDACKTSVLRGRRRSTEVDGSGEVHALRMQALWKGHHMTLRTRIARINPDRLDAGIATQLAHRFNCEIFGGYSSLESNSLFIISTLPRNLSIYIPGLNAAHRNRHL